MKLTDFGDKPEATWFKNILEWSRKKVSIDDNLDCVTLSVDIATSETAISHPLGRVPKGIIPFLTFPGSLVEMDVTRAPINTQLFLKSRIAVKANLLIF